MPPQVSDCEALRPSDLQWALERQVGEGFRVVVGRFQIMNTDKERPWLGMWQRLQLQLCLYSCMDQTPARTPR